MRELAILTFITLDGVMQAPGLPDEDPSGGFTHGGWADSYWTEVMEHVMVEAMADPYDLLLGRKTYEIFAGHFADSAGLEAKTLNDATKYVATKTLGDLKWKNSVRIEGDVAQGVSGLKRQDGPLLQVHGSWQLIQTLLSHDLIDEFRLWVFPVVVGAGKRLFEQVTAPKSLTLTKTKPTSNGVVMNIYRRR